MSNPFSNALAALKNVLGNNDNIEYADGGSSIALDEDLKKSLSTLSTFEKAHTKRSETATSEKKSPVNKISIDLSKQNTQKNLTKKLKETQEGRDSK